MAKELVEALEGVVDLGQSRLAISSPVTGKQKPKQLYCQPHGNVSRSEVVIVLRYKFDFGVGRSDFGSKFFGTIIRHPNMC